MWNSGKTVWKSICNFFCFFVLFLKMWSRGWGWGRCPLTNVADWKRRRGREALFWTSKWCTTRPPARPTGQQIQLSPKQRNIFDGLQEINHPQGTTMPRMKIWETKWFCMCSNAQVTIHLFLNYCQWDSSLIPPFIIDNLFGKVP